MPIGKRTAAQIAASRRNGAKSKGPLSLEGKAALAQNAFKHGFTARTLLGPGESAERFNALLHSFVHDFSPQTDAEFLCVEEMAAAKWRMRRAWTFEQRNLASLAQDEYKAEAWNARQHHFESGQRYEARLQRQFARSLRELQYEGCLAEADDSEPPVAA